MKPLKINRLNWKILYCPIVLNPSEGWNALSQELKVLSVQDLRIALDKGNLSKDAIEYLLGIFPNAKRVLISAVEK